MSLYGNIDSVAFQGIAATPAAFPLKGGMYALTVHATWGGGSLALNRLAADGVTYIPVLPSSVTADNFQTVNLPQGTYQMVVTTATAIYCDITSVAAVF